MPVAVRYNSGIAGSNSAEDMVVRLLCVCVCVCVCVAFCAGRGLSEEISLVCVCLL